MTRDSCGRRSHVIPAAIILLHVAKADLTRLPKIHAGSATDRVDRHQTRILRGFENPPTARLSLVTSGVEPGRHAAVHQPVSVVSIQIDLRIVRPALLAGFGVQGDHAIERHREVKRAIDENRRGFEAAPLPPISPLGNVARVIDLRNLELRHVLALDLSRRRIPHPTRIVSVRGPLRSVGILRAQRRFRQSKTDHQKQGQRTRPTNSFSHRQAF